MTIHINSTTYQCPLCSAPAQGQTISESCRLLPASSTVSTELTLKTCIQSAALRKFLEGGIAADPCQQCSHNELIENTGTFVAMKQLGEHEWGELHLCPNCKTFYIVSTSNTK